MTEVHPSHEPEPDGSQIYRGGTACRRCLKFVAFDQGTAFAPRVTERGEQPCAGPARLSLRGSQ